jgi:hypothetical protein
VLREGFLGIEPHFELWRYFFAISLVNKRDGSTVPIGCAGIHLHEPRAREYMAIATMKSNKGWHLHWFYVKNVDAAPLPLFTGRTIVVAPPEWSWGPVDKEKKRVAPLMSTIVHLKGHGLHGAGVIGTYHSRRVAPLMARVLPLFGMAARVQLEGTTLAPRHTPKLGDPSAHSGGAGGARCDLPGRGSPADVTRH